MMVWYGRFPGAMRLGWPLVQREVVAAVLQRDPRPRHDDAAPEARVVGLDERDHHAVAVGGAEVDRAAARRPAR